jgi:sigma-B regulation protein RsbQ
MSVQHRNNVRVHSDGPVTMLFAHGFGCDQNMWRYLAPSFRDRFRVVTFDSVGSGGSDLKAYDRKKYGSLHGYADDVLEIVDEFSVGPVVFVGHSVSAIVGLLATNKAPDRFAAQIMVGPSPCYINDGDYIGGFTREDIDDILVTMEGNYLGWSSNMAPAIMGVPDQPHLRAELTESFCRNDPEIARHFAEVTFLSDHRADVPESRTPALILQCSEDLIAPLQVGKFMHENMPDSVLCIINNVGHCPHMSAATASYEVMDRFLSQTLG